MASNEIKVISAVCKNKDIHTIIGEDRELFGSHADVFDFMKEHYLNHRAVPEMSVVQSRFKNVEAVETTSPSAYYVERLRDAFVRGRLEKVLLQVEEQLDGGTAAPLVVDKLMGKLSALGRYSSSVEDLNLKDGENASEHFERLRVASLDGGRPGIATGFKSIDSCYPTGMAKGHSIVLMGYSGRGKSYVGGLLALQAAKQKKKVMIYSLEMPPEEYRERMYAMMSDGQFKTSELSRGEVDPDDFRTWTKDYLDNMTDFVVVSTKGADDVTPNKVQAKIDIHRPDIVVLDYLQLMTDNANTQAMTPRMLNLSREIKLLAMSNNIPIISITAVTDEESGKRDGPPVMSQVAWSKGIEYNANMVIVVHRHDDPNNIVEIVCRKNRHGEMFDFGFEVQWDEGIWTERFDAF